MENNQEGEVQEVKLIITEEVRSYLYDMTKWCRMLSNFGFFISAILLIGSIGIPAMIEANPALLSNLGSLGKSGNGPAGLTIAYIILGLVYLYPSLLLNRFAKKGKQGVLFGDQESFNLAMSTMKSLFKFMGILTLVVFVSYFLLMIFSGVMLA